MTSCCHFCPSFQPSHCFISSNQIACVCVYETIQSHVNLCLWIWLYVYTKGSKGFSIASQLTRLPWRSWGGSQRHYSAIKLLFAGVTLSGGCVDRGRDALKVQSYTHTHISLRQGCLRARLVAAAPWVDGA